MKNFRDYETLIRNKVKEINDKDPNWDWSIKSFGKNKVCIRWSYLDYCEEKDNCFILRLVDPDKEFNDQFLTARTPQDDMIEGYFVSEDHRYIWDTSWENGLIAAIEEIAHYAHSRY